MVNQIQGLPRGGGGYVHTPPVKEWVLNVDQKHKIFSSLWVKISFIWKIDANFELIGSGLNKRIQIMISDSDPVLLDLDLEQMDPFPRGLMAV